MTTMITSAKTTLFEIMITNKQINKQTNTYIEKMNVIFIVMKTMITSAKMTLFERMITNKQTSKMKYLKCPTRWCWIEGWCKMTTGDFSKACRWKCEIWTFTMYIFHIIMALQVKIISRPLFIYLFVRTTRLLHTISPSFWRGQSRDAGI